jgi:hypothetical protein
MAEILKGESYHSKVIPWFLLFSGGKGVSSCSVEFRFVCVFFHFSVVF